MPTQSAVHSTTRKVTSKSYAAVLFYFAAVPFCKGEVLRSVEDETKGRLSFLSHANLFQSNLLGHCYEYIATFGGEFGVLRRGYTK